MIKELYAGSLLFVNLVLWVFYFNARKTVAIQLLGSFIFTLFLRELCLLFQSPYVGYVEFIGVLIMWVYAWELWRRSV
jgi:hypothetical protein